MAERPIVVTGAGGRLGRLLRRVWGEEAALWLTRADWDIGRDLPPALPPGGVVLDLAGVTRGAVEANAAIAAEVAAMARARDARLIHVSSAAVYPGGPGLMSEDRRPDPPSPYGAAKLAAESAVRAAHPQPAILRLGNVAGADAVLGGGARPRLLDPVEGQPGGPVRSYIGPILLAQSLRRRCALPLPALLNLAQPHEVAMAGLMTAAGLDWRFGPARGGTLARVVLDTARAEALLPLPPATPSGLVAEWRALGGWP
jgi:hypothetical protein